MKGKYTEIDFNWFTGNELGPRTALHGSYGKKYDAKNLEKNGHILEPWEPCEYEMILKVRQKKKLCELRGVKMHELYKFTKLRETDMLSFSFWVKIWN